MVETCYITSQLHMPQMKLIWSCSQDFHFFNFTHIFETKSQKDNPADEHTLRLCPTLPSRRFCLPPSKYFLQTVLGLCYSFLSWFTYVSRRWQTVLDVLDFAVVQSLKRPASDRDWRFSLVTLAFVWRFHRYSGGTLYFHCCWADGQLV